MRSIKILTCLLALFGINLQQQQQRPAVLAERISLIPSQQQMHNYAPCDRSRKVFTAEYGEISDGPAGFNYTQDSHCEWLIKARNESQFITLTFHSMGTECSYDYIYVYDGDSFNSTLLGSFSGRTQPQRLVARSGSVSTCLKGTLIERFCYRRLKLFSLPDADIDVQRY